MTKDEVRDVALAIAKANDNKDPHGWADSVVEHYVNPNIAAPAAEADVVAVVAPEQEQGQ